MDLTWNTYFTIGLCAALLDALYMGLVRSYVVVKSPFFSVFFCCVCVVAWPVVPLLLYAGYRHRKRKVTPEKVEALHRNIRDTFKGMPYIVVSVDDLHERMHMFTNADHEGRLKLLRMATEVTEEDKPIITKEL